jgi:hypothetical protein
MRLERDLVIGLEEPKMDELLLHRAVGDPSLSQPPEVLESLMGSKFHLLGQLSHTAVY